MNCADTTYAAAAAKHERQAFNVNYMLRNDTMFADERTMIGLMKDTLEFFLLLLFCDKRII